MASAPVLRIVPASETPWDDIVQVFGTRGDPAGCWCQYFKVSNKAWNTAGREKLEALLREQVSEGSTGPGLIAYADGEPAGWCAVEPRPRYPRILTSKIATSGRQEPDVDESVWAITCVVVKVGYRRRGICAALVSAAVEEARKGGARVIEGYPVDLSGGAKASSAELYHGTVSVFGDAGFEVVARPTARRAVMRLEL
ncbi:MAG: GNAT family N-acetyltransferase [Actinomycetota bacterium]|nr:GNAT family N-acetyltransferase [Actinomycetota bacterium]